MSSTIDPITPFRIDPQQAGPLLRAAKPAVERALRFGKLNAIYHGACDGDPGDAFEDRTLAHLGIQVDVAAEHLARIPTTGPLVAVANHPFGGIEGMIFASLLRRVRPDVRLMANYMLSVIPQLRELFIFVDPFGSRDAVRRNVAAVRQAINWVQAGGALGVFPAGEVSHLNLRQRVVADPTWHDTTARIIQRTGADALPVYFDGRNSNLFQLMGVLHPRLRTLMLPHELIKREGSRVCVRIGHAVPYATLKKYDSAKKITASLRLRTYHLKPAQPNAQRAALDHELIAEPIDAQVIASEIASLKQDQLLASQKMFDVFIASADQIPAALDELGRLREIAFRKVGEGSGKARDLDRFDPYYLHLFVWDRQQQQIAGAYRLGLTDDILPQFGRRGLYTSTLFHFKRQLLEQIDPAIELGRSFVSENYQKSYLPLMLLWRGIGTFLARHPRYKHLFGPVSISAEYSTMSKHLLMAFLKLHKYLPDLARLLRPRNPPKPSTNRAYNASDYSLVVGDLDQVNDLVRSLEADGKPMPVLLRQYLQLNAQLLGFNVDPDFGDVLDGLMLVDVTRVEPKVLRRYMGKDAAEQYLAHHCGE